MTQKVVAVVGVSGSGKTTFLKELAKKVKFQHLSAGSLIFAERRLQEASRDDLRLSGVKDNQELLIDGFNRAKGSTESLVVLDGHVVVHAIGGLEPIDAEVFEAMNVVAFVHLISSPEQIVQNRKSDSTRKRPAITHSEAAVHQSFSCETATKIARHLRLPILMVEADELDLASTFLSNL